MELRHPILLLMSMLSLSPAPFPASGQPQGATVAQVEPLYGPTFGPIAVVTFEWRQPGLSDHSIEPTGTSRGLGEWPSPSALPPALYARRGGLSPDLFRNDYWDGLPSVQHPGLGLTALPIHDAGKWTIGLLANQPAPGSAGQANYLSRFVDPFVSYTTSDALTVMLTTEPACNASGQGLSLPLNLIFARPIVSGSSMSIGAGFCYWNNSVDAGSNGIGFHIGATIRFP